MILNNVSIDANRAAARFVLTIASAIAANWESTMKRTVVQAAADAQDCAAAAALAAWSAPAA